MVCLKVSFYCQKILPPQITSRILIMFSFSHQFVTELAGDPITENFPRQVEAACYSLVKPTRTSNPQLIAISHDVAASLNLSEHDLNSSELNNLLTGNQLHDGMKPYAMRYGGHQFGHWAGQLGDGRAINLGEVIDKNAIQQTLQLKGAGPTPYSRTADGLAVLRSSIREFLCSEAMYALGISTTRALSLGLTGDKVLRDMFYDGNSGYEQGAIVCRVAPSFLRFGHFQLHAAQNEIEILKQLMDYSIVNNFQHLGTPNIKVYEAWFDEICHSTMDLMLDWMRVGFVHGVMNTDNMSILSQTIDYGPYGWLENIDMNWTPNTTDEQGKRYSFGNQPSVAHWNLYQLANALMPIVGRVESLEKSLNSCYEKYQQDYQIMLSKKLGLLQYLELVDKPLIDELFNLFTLTEIDMTIFFRRLGDYQRALNYTDEALIFVIKNSFYDGTLLENKHSKAYKKIISWLRKYLLRLVEQQLTDEERKISMALSNPKVILRNYLVQVAIEKAEQGDYSEITKLHEIMKNPYDEQPQHEEYAQKRPDWAKNKAGCSMLSCSS